MENLVYMGVFYIIFRKRIFIGSSNRWREREIMRPRQRKTVVLLNVSVGTKNKPSDTFIKSKTFFFKKRETEHLKEKKENRKYYGEEEKGKGSKSKR